MKTLYRFLCFTLLVNLARAQDEGTLTQFQPPGEISDRFKKEYPAITPTWHVEEKYYIASFADTSTFKGRSVAYDEMGRIVRRETEMENSSYPARINDYFVKNYPGEKFRTYRSVDDKGVQRYCIKRSSGTVWFDKNGNFIDPEKKNEEATAARIE